MSGTAVYAKVTAAQPWVQFSAVNGIPLNAPIFNPIGESPDGTIVTPTNGATITDAAGNKFTLTSGLVAQKNGVNMPDGAGTGQLEYYNHTLYGQDNTTKNWYTWSNTTSTWTPATAPPGGTPVTPSNPVSVATSLNVPWAIGFLPDKSFLVTQRDTFSVRHCSSTGSTLGSFTVPNTVTTSGEGGLMGLAVDPNFGTNSFIYICHTRTYNGGYTSHGNEVIRYTLNATANTISSGTVLLTYGSGQFHNGGGLGIGPDGKLYILTGNGTNPNNTSQVLTGAAINDGKILRINLDGTIPSDNPFNTDGTKATSTDGKTRSAVWTWGHRNPQGICWDADGNCWTTENGPTGESFGTFTGIRGNDKINLIKKGLNYGFPLTYGAGTATDSFGITTQAPIFTSGNNEVWAPEGIAYCNGSIFFCALGGLGSPAGTASLNQFTIANGAATSGITKHLTDGHRKRAAMLIPG